MLRKKKWSVEFPDEDEEYVATNGDGDENALPPPPVHGAGKRRTTRSRGKPSGSDVVAKKKAAEEGGAAGKSVRSPGHRTPYDDRRKKRNSAVHEE